MIYVSCGHEKGIGLEVFLKSFLLLNKKQQSLFKLFSNRKTLEENLKNLNLSFSINQNSCVFTSAELKTELDEKLPISDSSFKRAIKAGKENDILITLPTTKDQLILRNSKPAGHTEFLREYFKIDVSMFFKSEEANVLLISDHIPLKDVCNLNAKDIIKHIDLTIKEKKKYFSETNTVYIAGINPHAGEDGILGNEDSVINESIVQLKKTFPMVNFHGPLPADSMLVNRVFKEDSLFVYLYHDQGLAPFKTLFKTKGANISLGLPFLRLSVDHGTAFDLYGKNTADYMGCSYVLNLALKAHENIG